MRKLLLKEIIFLCSHQEIHEFLELCPQLVTLVRFGGQPGRHKIFNMIDSPDCTVYIHGGRMKDFLISPCSVYIRTLVYIWQRIRYKNGSYLFCVRKLSNVWSL